MNILVLGMIVGLICLVLGLVVSLRASDDAAGCSGTLLYYAGGMMLVISALAWSIKMGWLYF